MTRTKKQSAQNFKEGFIAGAIWTNTPMAMVFIFSMVMLVRCQA